MQHTAKEMDRPIRRRFEAARAAFGAGLAGSGVTVRIIDRPLMGRFFYRSGRNIELLPETEALGGEHA
jgi:hypothetical protein